jgi:thioredoxin-like negative regulator of GroEL
MKKASILLLIVISINWSSAQNKAEIREFSKTFTTYPFGSPDPIANAGPIYPYFRFNDFTDKPEQKSWKVVELENEFIRVWILPEVGGKIWTAIEKRTGKAFIYNNQVVKFRDVAMRGPWTSGGIEANYGIMGHTPNCATPVDYTLKKNDDGSVSCFIGTLDLLTRTNWMLEIKLPADKAWFSTRSHWFNSNPLEQPYYTWMNAGIKAAGDLEFIYPGNSYVGHEGEYSNWPINLKESKNIARYEENNFGTYKSYHVFGKYSDFFGAYWHQDKIGMGRFSWHDEKPGKKIWIWGLSRQGMIWDKLLTDQDGQYVEVQSGRLFNQAADGSSLTPFKHFGFAPYQTDEWTEYWYPVVNTGGITHSNNHGSLLVKRINNKLYFTYQTLEQFQGALEIRTGDNVFYSKKINLKTLESFRDSVSINGDEFKFEAGQVFTYESNPDDALSRPLDAPANFNWSSAYGSWLAGKEALRSRYYDKAEIKFKAALAQEPTYLPALTELANLYFRKGDYENAREVGLKGLAIDTYDPATNFIYGLANAKLNRFNDARDGFDIAALSASHRSSAYTELAKLYYTNGNLSRALDFSLRATENNTSNLEAIKLSALIYRKQSKMDEAELMLKKIKVINPLNQFIQAETWIASGKSQDLETLKASTRNELPHETYLELANWYMDLGAYEDAENVLSAGPENPESIYWRAYLNYKTGGKEYMNNIQEGNKLSAELVFPFRPASAKIFEWVVTQTDSWKPKYYLALIYRGAKDPGRALTWIKACGETPDFAPFYVIRTELTGATDYTDLKKAASLKPNEWIYGKRLFELALKNKDFGFALTTAKNYHQRFRTNSNLIMMHAKALLLNDQYKACNDLLAKSSILPYEGSTDARQVYWGSWIMTATQNVQQKKYGAALKAIEKSKLWPEQLGVGKPYDADIDLRAEDLIEYFALKGSGSAAKANQKLKEINARKDGNSPMGMLAYVLAEKLKGNISESSGIMDSYAASQSGNTFAQWCREMITNGSSKIEITPEQEKIGSSLIRLAK